MNKVDEVVCKNCEGIDVDSCPMCTKQTWADAQRALLAHHIEETSSLIEKKRKLEKEVSELGWILEGLRK